MEREVTWTEEAESDLQNIYNFNSPLMGEQKAFQLIEKLVLKTDILNNEVLSGTRYISNRKPEINYQKLVYGNYLIIYRVEENLIYIVRVFDARQDPAKLKL
ncbi:MAG: type II toxin-antitoxin system RelE/ParE family toxin [Cyclobacteriaceae bacterium]